MGHFGPPPETADPAAPASAHGANSRAPTPPSYRSKTARTIWRGAKPGHRRFTVAALALLVADEPRLWAGLPLVLRARLTESERASLAWGALRALPDEARQMVYAAAAEPRIGPPKPPLLGLADEAASWAEWASRDECRVYALAAARAMAPADRAWLLETLRQVRCDG